VGGMSAMVVDPKVIFQKALERKACSVILSHNHPSGATSPSTEDIRLTEKIKSAGSFMDIKVLDHVIIGEGAYYSFADEGKM
jgi:DNA repair protein RadC